MEGPVFGGGDYRATYGETVGSSTRYIASIHTKLIYIFYK